MGLAAAAMAQGKPACESQIQGGDQRAIKCSLMASGNPQRFHFKADFSGSHDDTTASLAATLDGAPLACDPGSKTSLQYEDGEVSLECRFSIRDKAGAPHVLGVTLQWRHAQYTDFGLDSD